MDLNKLLNETVVGIVVIVLSVVIAWSIYAKKSDCTQNQCQPQPEKVHYKSYYQQP